MELRTRKIPLHHLGAEYGSVLPRVVKTEVNEIVRKNIQCLHLHAHFGE